MTKGRYKFKTKPLYPKQAKALKKLVKNKGNLALLCDPGTGKTWIVVNYLGMLTESLGQCDVLITAPLSALDTWVDQFDAHLPDRIPRELIVLDEGSILEKAETIKNLPDNPGLLRAVIINDDAFKYRHLVPGLSTVTVQDRIIKAVTKHWQPDVLVKDESHRIKTHTSNVSKAHAKTARHIFRCILMTGTVAPKYPLDVYGQWQTLNPQRLPDRWDDFRYRVAIYGGWEGREILGYRQEGLDWLKRQIAKDSYVIKKREVLDLHVPTDINIPVHLSPKEEDYYLEMGKELMVELPSGAKSISPNVLTKMLRLRQITSGYVGYKDDVGETHTEIIGESKLQVCLDKVETLVESDEKVVIFAHFRPDIQRLSDALSKRYKKIPVYSVHGDTPKDRRKEQRKDFYNDEEPAIFVAQMRTMSLAVNEFVVASYAIFYSMSERRDDYEQARDRLDRQGQTEPVVFYHLVVPHSIDDAMLQGHREKGSLEKVILGRAKEVLTLGHDRDN